jgi:hypothetical protein
MNSTGAGMRSSRMLLSGSTGPFAVFSASCKRKSIYSPRKQKQQQQQAIISL